MGSEDAVTLKKALVKLLYFCSADSHVFKPTYLINRKLGLIAYQESVTIKIKIINDKK